MTTPDPKPSPEDRMAAALNSPTATTPAQDAPPGYVTKAEMEAAIKAAVSSAQSGNQAANTRERYIRERLSDIPLRLQNTLPMTGDLKELQAAEQQLREDLGQYFTGKGYRVPDVGGAPPGAIPDFIGAVRSMTKRTDTPTQRLADAISSDLLEPPQQQRTDPILPRGEA